MHRLIPAAAVVLSAALPARAAEVDTFTLDNGMEVVVLEDHRAPVVVQMVWYRVGAADEEPGVSGVAHYLEHLMFKGTDDLEPGEFSRVVAAQGGSDNAFTGPDYTAYFQRVAADRLGLMMEMEADRMRDLQLDDRDIATELRVVQEERNQRIENDPGALFAEQRDTAQYLNHPYGRPVIGWMHEVEALELDGRDPDAVARELGITRNNLNVRRHRARRQLRERLEAMCTACPDHGFHACDCPPREELLDPKRPGPDPAIR